jgi:hypothetical protein
MKLVFCQSACKQLKHSTKDWKINKKYLIANRSYDFNLIVDRTELIEIKIDSKE